MVINYSKRRYLLILDENFIIKSALVFLFMPVARNFIDLLKIRHQEVDWNVQGWAVPYAKVTMKKGKPLYKRSYS